MISIIMINIINIAVCLAPPYNLTLNVLGLRHLPASSDGAGLPEVIIMINMIIIINMISIIIAGSATSLRRPTGCRRQILNPRPHLLERTP